MIGSYSWTLMGSTDMGCQKDHISDGDFYTVFRLCYMTLWQRKASNMKYSFLTVTELECQQAMNREYCHI